MDFSKKTPICKAINKTLNDGKTKFRYQGIIIDNQGRQLEELDERINK